MGSEMCIRDSDHLATRPDIDARRIIVQGRSWSGYWAAKLAITERGRLRGAVMHGGPIHHYFQPDWQIAFWGTNYPRLAAVKRKYDPQGLFFVHHGVGSEAWSADGFTRV